MLFDSREHTMLRFPTIILWEQVLFLHEIFVLILALILVDQHCDCADQVH